jgi:soluble lytic murein transglycosylase
MKKKFKYILGTLLVIVPCAFTVLIYNDKITHNSPQYYKQGVKFYNNGDYSNAYYNFGKIKWISPLYPMAIYKQAKSAQKAGDFKTAAIKFKLFLSKEPNSIFDTSARLALAKSYYYSKQYDEARKQFFELKQKTNNDGTEEVYYLGLIAKRDDIVKAGKYFKDYLIAALADKALNNNFILQAVEELSSFHFYMTNEDVKLYGIAYYKSKKYKKALEYFSRLPIESCWDYLVLSNYYAGNKIIAKKLIETGLLTYSKTVKEDSIREIYDVYSTYMVGTKVKIWTEILKSVQQNALNGEDYVLYKLAELQPLDKSIILYQTLVDKYPQSNYAAESLWKVILYKYLTQDYQNAEFLALKHIKTYKKVKSTPKVTFWLAKTLLKEHRTQEANNLLSRLATKYSDDYYGLRAENLLSNKNDFWSTNTKNLIPEQQEGIEFPITVSEENIKNLKMINSVLKLGDYDIWQDANFTNPIVESWFELKKDKKSHSMVLARDEIEKMEVKPYLKSAAYQLTYPRYWVSEINTAGNKLGIDPYLIISVIREESYFNENSKSATGATGLMQLMPQTANYIISKYPQNINSFANLDNPRVNLFIGCNYLKYLKDKFNNDVLVIAAYNGGEGSVTKWIKTYNTNDYDEFIEQIPFEETQNYIKKIFRTYHMYQKIYE